MNKYLLLFIFASILFISCDDDDNEYIPDVSHIEVDYEVIRFEKELMNSSVDELIEKYPAFANIFFQNIMPVKREQNYQAVFDTIRSQPDFGKLLDTTAIVFQDFNRVKKDLSKAFTFLNYYLPEIDVPDVYTLVSGFAYQRFILADDKDQNIVGIGLDMFLGEDFPYGSIAMDNPAFSNYLTRSFNKEHLSKKTIELILEDYMPKPQKNQLLDQMIYNGKKLYLLNKILPEKSDTVIMEYTADQWSWIQENEMEMWAYFLKEKLFYESNSQKIGKYINPSPHSPGMPPSAPGRTANYLGWQIVKAYLGRHPETSIQELLELNDAQKFLQKSRYKPRK